MRSEEENKMTITLENISVYIGMISFAALAVNFIVISPLRAALLGLQASIDRLDSRLSILDTKIDDDRERIAVVEQSAKQAHKRIDRIDGVVGGVK